jgi:carboxypeptidase family protein
MQLDVVRPIAHGRRAAAALAVLAGAAVTAIAQGSAQTAASSPRLLGVYDGDTGLPVEGAQVTDVGRQLTALTSKTGTVSLRFLADGESLVRIRKVGYEAVHLVVTISPADTVPVTVVLHASAQRLPVIVSRDTARPMSPGLRAFEERRRAHNGGQFITVDVLRKNDNSSMTNVIRRFSGIKVTCAPFPPECHATATRQITRYAIRGGACEPDMYIDGILVNDRDLQKLQVSEYGGVEYYQGGASIPIQYNKTSASCGVLLFWSRDAANEGDA